MSNLLQRIVDAFREEPLFLTHTPAKFKIGEIYEGNGKVYRITSISRVGRSQYFEVRGVAE